VEAHQILNTLNGLSKGWQNHPATRMWRGYESGLTHYYNVFWTHCTQELGIKAVKLQYNYDCYYDPIKMPPWWGYEPFHAAHRSNLLRKNATYYGNFKWTESDDLPYIWPVDKDHNLIPEVQQWIENIQSTSIIATAP
jgi:hypothetical protein